jgi:hypothetical protein
MKRFTTAFIVAALAVTASVADGALIISEIVDGTLPEGLPKWVELTNTGDSAIDLSGYSIGNYTNGSTTLGGGSSLVLSGMLAAGDSYVVNYEVGDVPGDSTFFDVYGFDPDNFDNGAFFNGDDVLAIFLADGSGPGGAASGDGSDATLVDLYGVIGVDGSGEAWEYMDGYSYRNADIIVPSAIFTETQWFIGGTDSLDTGDDVEELALLQTLTTPGTHVFVPEPATFELFVLGGLSLLRRR